MSLINEALSSALGATRRDLQDLLDSVGSQLASSRVQLERRLASVVGQTDDPATGADGVLAVTAEFSSPEFSRLAAKLLVGAGGMTWGIAIVSASLNAGGAVAIMGLGIALEPVIALLLGLVILAVSGVFAWRVLKELLRRLESSAVPQAMD